MKQSNKRDEGALTAPEKVCEVNSSEEIGLARVPIAACMAETGRYGGLVR